MPKAVLRNGVIYPIEPLPEDWRDGQELWVEETPSEASAEDIDRWWAELEEMCSANDPEDLARIEESLRQADEMAKAAVRRQMGL